MSVQPYLTAIQGTTETTTGPTDFNQPFAANHLLLTDERNCLPLPDELSFEVGALLACNTSTAYSAMQKLSPSGRDTLVVFGLGPVGLNGLLIAKAMGAQVFGVDISATRQKLAEELGADAVFDRSRVDVPAEVRARTAGDGAMLAFETSGNGRAQAQMLDVLGYGGKAALVGIGSSEPSINPSALVGNQLSLMGSSSRRSNSISSCCSSSTIIS